MGELQFHRLAEHELNEAAQYYEREEAGFGAAFLQEVDRTLQSIQAHPEAGILYKIKPTGIRVLAVMNLRRRPTYWVGRE